MLLRSTMPAMPSKLSDERLAAGRRLRALFAGDGDIRAMGRLLDQRHGTVNAEQSLRQWFTGRGFGNAQRRKICEARGLPLDYFGVERSGAAAAIDDATRRPTRWASLQDWLDRHADVDPELEGYLRAIDALLPCDMGPHHYDLQARLFDGARAQAQALAASAVPRGRPLKR